jgi:hypothetical protein
MGRLLQRYWGYIALAFAILGWIMHTLGYTLILVLSLAALVYFLVQAPLWCGAEIRGGRTCRNNSRGLLLGCHLREHKWQRLKDALVARKWQKTIYDLFDSPREILATFSGLTSLVSFVMALVAFK